MGFSLFVACLTSVASCPAQPRPRVFRGISDALSPAKRLPRLLLPVDHHARRGNILFLSREL